MTITRRRGVLLGATALAVALAATACGSSSSSGGSGKTSSGSAQSATVTDADLQAALTAGGNLTVWAWEPTLKKVVADFQTKYPNVHVNLVNAGTGNDEYKALQNAVQAGKGVPDVAHIEYYALPQFELTKSVANLDQFGAASLERHVHHRSVERRPGRRRRLRPADGLRPDGPVLQPDRLRQERHHHAPGHVGGVHRRREEDPRRRPDRLHHQRHRRRGLHHQHDLAGRRQAVLGQRHQRRRELRRRRRHAEVRHRLAAADRRPRPGADQLLERRLVPGHGLGQDRLAGHRRLDARLAGVRGEDRVRPVARRPDAAVDRRATRSPPRTAAAPWP